MGTPRLGGTLIAASASKNMLLMHICQQCFASKKKKLSLLSEMPTHFKSNYLWKACGCFTRHASPKLDISKQWKILTARIASCQRICLSHTCNLFLSSVHSLIEELAGISHVDFIFGHSFNIRIRDLEPYNLCTLYIFQRIR